MNNNKNRVEIDILIQILDYVDIENIDIAITVLMPQLNGEEKKVCKNNRLSPVKYFAKLVPQSSNLLKAMGNTRTVLSGSRALDYFYPGMCNANSDWNFYCEGKCKDFILFIEYTKKLGIKWNNCSSFNLGHNGMPIESPLVLGTVANKNIKYKVQLMLCTINSETILDVISRFHSSALQCFIHAIGAVSMYYRYTVKGCSIPWICENQKSAIQCRQKYKERGLRYISCDVLNNKRSDGPLINHEQVVTRNRYINDNECECIGFNKYYSNIHDKVAVRIAQLHFNKTECWEEKGYCCNQTWINIISRTDFSTQNNNNEYTLFYKEELWLKSEIKKIKNQEYLFRKDSVKELMSWMSIELVDFIIKDILNLS